MTIGVLLVTHYGIGDALIQVAESTFGDELPLSIGILSVSQQPKLDELLAKAKAHVDDLDQGQGVLIITDMFGATPSNIAQALAGSGRHVAVVAGLNLPMLIRVLNYPTLSLDALAEKALSGGKEGVFFPAQAFSSHRSVSEDMC